MGDGGGPNSDGILGRRTRRKGGLVGGGTDPERGRWLPRHGPRGGDVEGGGGDSQSLLRRLHRLPRLPPRVPSGSRYGDHHPQGQSSPAFYSLEGGSAPCDIP